MKKYLIIGDGESPHILKWARELNKHFEVYLVSSTGSSSNIQDILPEENIYDFGLKPEDKGGNFQYIKLIRPLRRIIGYVSPDFVNAHYITSHGVLAAIAERPSKRKYKLILSAWGTDILITPFKNPFYRAITRLALNRADLVTTDSIAVADIVHKLSSTHTMSFPFGLDKLPEVHLDDKDQNLFFSNRTLNKNSNIDKVLHFFSKILEKKPSSELIIGNDGPLKDELQSLCHQLGIIESVKFVGFTTPDGQNEYYRRAGFFFSVLTSDALSVSLLEAMAFGCIPIVSDLPDNREWVEDGDNGIIMNEKTDVNTLSLLMERSSVIFKKNRELVGSKALFPDAIENYCLTISHLS